MKRFFIPIFFCMFIAPAYAQLGDVDELFIWEVKPGSEQVEQGHPFEIQASLTVAADHIVYKNMTKLSAELPEGFQAGESVFGEAHTKTDPIDGMQKEVFTDTSVHKLPVYVSPDTPPGEYEIKVKTEHQGCSKTVCYFPQSHEFTVKITVVENTSGVVNPVPGEIDFDQIKANSMTAESSGSDDFFAEGYFWTYLTIFGVGILTCFTPCVYPLIPITVTIFGARESKSKLQAFTLAFTYVLGIVVMYATLGFIAAKTGAVFGQFLSNPLVIGFIVAVFAAMGASMLGAFELQLPSSWQMKLTQMGGKGYTSAFFMGLVAGIIAAPCTGPVLIGILTYVATSGNSFLGISLLMTYAFGLGLLFLIIGTFSGFISKMPKSGSWMESVKSVFGIILFAFAFYYLKEIFDVLKAPLDNSTTNYVIAFVVFAVGVAIGAVHLSYHTHNLSVRIRKTVGVAACVFALYLGIGSLTAVQADNVSWVYSLDEGLETARAEGKPVMIDFYADWCSVCKEIEAFTFATDEVGEELKRFTAIKVDLTDNTPETQKIMQLFNIKGLPHLAFFDSKGNRLEEKRVLEFISKEDFLTHVKDIQ